MSVAAQIQRNAFREIADDDETNQEAEEVTDQRIDVLERDLTRLTLVVEEVAKSQKKQQEDLTKATLILERIADKIGPLN